MGRWHHTPPMVPAGLALPPVPRYWRRRPGGASFSLLVHEALHSSMIHAPAEGSETGEPEALEMGVPGEGDLPATDKVVDIDDALEEFYLQPSLAGARNGAATTEFMNPPSPNTSVRLSRDLSSVYQNDTGDCGDFAGADTRVEGPLGAQVGPMPAAATLLVEPLPSPEFADVLGALVDPAAGFGPYRQTVFALVVSEAEQEEGETGRLFIHTGERWDQLHTTVVNVVRSLVYPPEGSSPQQVFVVSAGTLLYQRVPAAGWEVVALLNDSGHFKPKSKSVRFVYQKLQALGYDCVRICKGTNEILALLSQREAEKEQVEFDPIAHDARAQAWVEFVTENYSGKGSQQQQQTEWSFLKGSSGDLHKLGRRWTREEEGD